MKTPVKKLPLEEIEALDIAFWKDKSPEEKLDMLQYLRELYYTANNESRKRFQRVYRVIKQEQGPLPYCRIWRT